MTKEVVQIYYLNKNPRKNPTKIIAMIGVGLVFIVFLYLIISKVWGLSFFPQQEIKDFPIKGVQVSADEGHLDWQSIEESKLSFGYIQATEGSSYQDDQFMVNWDRIKGTNLRHGASHYFSFDSPGSTQAENFLQVYQPTSSDLPPAIIIEFYGNKQQNPPDKTNVETELKAFISTVSEATQQQLVLCTNRDIYERYINGKFPETLIWLVDTTSSPDIKEPIKWSFWEYTEDGTLGNKAIKQNSLDLVVYRGSEAEFKALGQK